MTREFNADWKAEYGQLNLEHAAKKTKIYVYIKKKLKQTKASVQVRSKSEICECSPNRTRETMEERICETAEF